MANKYRAIKVKYDGYSFDSKAEFYEYTRLKQLQSLGEISNLTVHNKYPIIVNGVKICVVMDDFNYFDHKTNQQVCVDVKGQDLPMSKLKRKLVKACYPDINWVLVHV